MNIASNEKLTICYNAWMIFNEDDNYDEQVRQIAERGFNCIRIEDGAGLIWDADGCVRNDILITSPFGKYTKYTTYRVIAESKRVNLFERLLRVCKAAKKYGVKVILSSWFFLHTNWFCEEKDTKHLFELSAREKFAFFADELSKILGELRKENLIDIVAYAEIFNEIDGLYFVRERASSQEIREMHEEEIGKLKSAHPDILFAVDVCTGKVDPELIPRNVDVFNFHCYYLWPIYDEFEKDVVQWSLDEPVIPEETRYFLKDEIVSVKEVADAMGADAEAGLKTGLDWPRRISLYVSIDEKKQDELSAFLDSKLKEKNEFFREKMHTGIEHGLETHKKTVPDSKIVLGEGATYCASPTLSFERDSESFWSIINEQMVYLREKGFYGSVTSTTHSPNRISAWEPCKDRYVRANNIFKGEK